MACGGAAQAVAFAIGGFLGAVGVGFLRGQFHQAAPAFLIVFCAEAVVFLISALLTGGVRGRSSSRPQGMEEGPSSLEFGGAKG